MADLKKLLEKRVEKTKNALTFAEKIKLIKEYPVKPIQPLPEEKPYRPGE